MKQKYILPVVLVVGLVCVFSASPHTPLASPAPVKPGRLPMHAAAVAAPLSISAVSHSQAFSVRSSVAAPANAPLLDQPAATDVAPISTVPTPLHGVRAQNGQALGPDGKLYPLYSYSATSLPNDPNANQPWVTAANLPAAWDVPRGNSPTVLAMIDTGFALKHQEFVNRWYTNSGESGATSQQAASRLNCNDRGLALNQSCNLIDDNHDGIVDNETGATSQQNPSQLNCSDQALPLDKSCNLIDDDNNGFIDDAHGWDFANNDRSVQAGQVNPSGSGTHHGTYTTGVAAASGNNGVGIAGVDWGTTILPIQALDDNGSGTTVSVANAIDYAVARHANVISLSLGSPSDDPLVHQAVDRAIAAGIVVVAAAGNDGCDCMLYPANYPEVVSVGALDPATSQPAKFSSYGSNLTLMAPGVNLYTTDWQANNQTSAYARGISGTSLATPIVSGLLTRLLSQQPQASAAQLVAALLENNNRLSLPASINRNNSLGFGLVNAGQASLRMATAFAPQQMYSFGHVSSGNYLSASAPAAAGGLPYQCESGAVGSTPLYLLSQAGQSFFTSSVVENQEAIDQGYSSRFFSYTCLSQPQDTPTAVRTINMLNEFLNLSSSYK